MMGPRITSDDDTTRPDSFLFWLESDQDNALSRLNSLFAEMRKSDIYQYKRMSMKMQFEVLKVGLEPSIKLINGQMADDKVLSED